MYGIMCAGNIFENSTEYDPTLQLSGSIEIKAGNSSDVGEPRELSCAVGIKTGWEEGIIRAPPGKADAKITLDYRDSGVHHTTSQYYGTAIFDRDRTNIVCKTYPLKNEMQCSIEDRRICLHTDGELADLCDVDVPVVGNSSELSNVENLNIVTTPVPSLKQRKIVEAKLENIDEFHEEEKHPHVKRIKTECEEDIHHVSPESTDADIIFGRDGENIECGTDNLEYDIKCKIEETEILFGTEFRSAAQGSSECANGKNLDVDTLSTQGFYNTEGTNREFPNLLNKAETVILKEEWSEDESISPKGESVNCNTSLKLKRNSDWHQTSRHSKPKRHKCPDCERNFITKSNLKRHQTSQHSKLKPHQCSDCEQSFTTKSNLKRHQKSQHLKLKPHECPDCDRSFVSKYEINQHRKFQHLKLKPHKCPDCERSFVGKYRLNEHQSSHHLKLKPHKCPDCEKSFSRKSFVHEHQVSQHLKLKPHRCLDCGESFAAKSTLNCHRRTQHLKLKPFKCADCDKSFGIKFSLNEHRMTQHLKLKPHKCPECDKSFVGKYKLNEHQKSHHLKLQPYQCPECENSFVSKYKLNQHKKCQHLKLKPYKCPDCERSFFGKHKLNKHKKLHCLKLQSYKCPKCDESFGRESSLDEHQAFQH